MEIRGYYGGMTLLIAPVSGEYIDDVRGQVEAAIAGGADAIELRLDLIGELSADDLRTLRLNTPHEVPFILTIRSVDEGGQWDGGDDDRVSRMIELGPFVDYIDVELELWRRSANIRQKIELALHRADPAYQDGGEDASSFVARRKLILSRHDFTGRPATLQKDLVEMLSEPACEVPKIAWRARTVRDNFEALELTRGCAKPPMLICMGEEGILSRVASRKFGAFGTFAAVGRGLGTAAGQPTIEEFTSLHRWDCIDRETALYGVIGDPVAHSLSPMVHNAAFAGAEINAVYVPLRVLPGYESFKAFMVEVLARPWLGFRGFSITIPHKENALRFLLESGGDVSADAQRIGAVNTLLIHDNGQVSGSNTDYDGVLSCLREMIGSVPVSKSPLRAAVLGAGGVARAVVAALRQIEAEITIYNRTPGRAAKLASAFACGHAPWEKRMTADFDLLVNCTAVGLAPDSGNSPMPAEALKPPLIVFDTVYRPVRTRLLQDAALARCRTISGLELFVRQAEAQYRTWTGRKPRDSDYDSAAIETLNGNADT